MIPLTRYRSINPVRRLLDDRRGANLVEYIILVGVIALIALAGYRQFGFRTRAKVDDQTEVVRSIGK